ncbi:Lrp/AsnC family transcriptional regulator [Amnibacterium kyonggiense]
MTIDDLDEHLLRLLADDGRSAWSELSEEVGVPVGRVRRRVDRMVAAGLLDFDVELAAQPIGFHARANLWLRVAPATMDRAARALSALPQVVFAAAVSGNANLLVIAHCRSTDELFDLTTRRLGEIADAQLLDVSSVTEQVKQAGTVLAHERLRR